MPVPNHLRTRRHPLLIACLAALALAACQRNAAPAAPADTAPPAAAQSSYARQHAGDYATVPLTADLSAFDENGKRMIALLVQASEVMNDLYWRQSWDGDRAALLARAPDDATRDLIALNFGPWDRLNADTPLLPGVGPRPPGEPFVDLGWRHRAAGLRDVAQAGQAGTVEGRTVEHQCERRRHPGESSHVVRGHAGEHDVRKRRPVLEHQ